MFIEYLANQERYQDLLREAEKERLLKLALKSHKNSQQESGLNSEPNSQAWFQKLSLFFRDAGLLAEK